MIARFVPLALKDFPAPRRDYDRRNSQFKAPWIRTLALLDKELANLGASGIVFQAGFNSDQIRQDGWPYGKASPSHPAVILSFRDAGNNPLSFPCDTYRTHGENIRAIALSLEALRAVDRFGVTKRSEQYAGFKAIEAVKTWTVEESAIWLAIKTGVSDQEIVRDAAYYRSAWRVAAKTLHPDAGGNPHEWQLLGDAKGVLDRHHGLASGGTA